MVYESYLHCTKGFVQVLKVLERTKKLRSRKYRKDLNVHFSEKITKSGDTTYQRLGRFSSVKE